VTDRRYWREAPTAPWGAQYLFAASPRTARVGVEARF
jgi:outer membrane receptor protein involved in Fe transport